MANLLFVNRNTYTQYESGARNMDVVTLLRITQILGFNLVEEMYDRHCKTATTKLSNLIIIGCSTGGPGALKTIVECIPQELNAAVLIVQHMPKGDYINNFATYLDRVCPLHVSEARDGTQIKNGRIYLAPGSSEMKITHVKDEYHISLGQGSSNSVDVLLESVAKADVIIPIYAAVLSGMGRDGLNGVQSLRENKRIRSTIIAQSQQTATIFGMPRQIIEHKLADTVLGTEEIIPYVVNQIRHS
jgi:two-component system chemotaxis response regulator CheB